MHCTHSSLYFECAVGILYCILNMYAYDNVRSWIFRERMHIMHTHTFAQRLEIVVVGWLTGRRRRRRQRAKGARFVSVCVCVCIVCASLICGFIRSSAVRHRRVVRNNSCYCFDIVFTCALQRVVWYQRVESSIRIRKKNSVFRAIDSFRQIGSNIIIITTCWLCGVRCANIIPLT